MRRFAWMMAAVLVVTALLTGCGGKKDAGSVTKDLNKLIGRMESYHGKGEMTLLTGIEPQKYAVEVSYKAKNYYRISLTNDKKDITQIVLRNDDGVFVLTPHLNKSFRFQSSWPEGQGQVYLLQSLVQSIVEDEDRKFTTDGDAYVFDVQANYSNASLVRQKVWLAKKNYAPRHVEVSDANDTKLVVFDFTEFEFDHKFDADSFDLQRNMTSMAIPSLPTTGKVDQKSDAAKSGDKAASGQTNGQTGDKSANGQKSGQAGAQAGDKAKSPSFGIVDPTYMPKGVKQQDISEVTLGETKGVMLRYNGTYTYSLVESMPADQAAAALKGTMVDLGYTLGLLSGDKHKTLIWTYDGIEYRLSTDNLPDGEMMKVAQSVQGQIGK